jgi:hypothetical protein
VGEAGAYDDELFAYLMLDYLRNRTLLESMEVLLTYRANADGIGYTIVLRPENDLVEGVAQLARVAGAGFAKGIDWRLVSENTLNDYRFHTATLQTAYNLPARRPLEDLSEAEKTALLRRYIRLKASTDGRVRRPEDAIPPLPDDAVHGLAADIVTVTRFYELPLDFFAGIGAMENNYHNQKGDLGNTVWKRRAQKGDIVVRRTKTRVLVLNESSGVWQITRETLRVAHKLYRKDARDYSLLPEHLRPPLELDLDGIDAEVLTTYAGLLLRDLLDRFDGDVIRAVGAYNGGPGRPNLQYAEGVGQAASHARRVLEQAALLHGRPAAGSVFLKPF